MKILRKDSARPWKEKKKRNLCSKNCIPIRQKKNCQTTRKQIEEILPFIQDDTELVRGVTGTIEKMKRMPDAQFAQLDLEPYRKEDSDE